ncbi:MAG TPA: bifunctional adenosylcobinamide kinase/adenosylcobinamide-phosphate guanylyltransferase [Selenomonadales bacterium]|nr:bifunctional adenosylcobinamide kinase/adenosylcobinamide-phosphate guanylyltransferase [Selenomonadales bacterium]
MSGKIVLVTGGARSGKSAFAEGHVARLGERIAYIATAQIYDDEMKARVDLHRRRRPAGWETYEAPYGAEAVLARVAPEADAVLFDCLTLYTSNLLLAADAPATPEERLIFIRSKITLLIEAARSGRATVVFVTNEVGMGIVPDNALAREYRDAAGLVNQQVAAAAGEVYLVVSGLAVELKKLAAATEGEVRHG